MPFSSLKSRHHLSCQILRDEILGEAFFVVKRQNFQCIVLKLGEKQL